MFSYVKNKKKERKKRRRLLRASPIARILSACQVAFPKQGRIASGSGGQLFVPPLLLLGMATRFRVELSKAHSGQIQRRSFRDKSFGVLHTATGFLHEDRPGWNTAAADLGAQIKCNGRSNHHGFPTPRVVLLAPVYSVTLVKEMNPCGDGKTARFRLGRRKIVSTSCENYANG